MVFSSFEFLKGKFVPEILRFRTVGILKKEGDARAICTDSNRS